MIEESGDGGIWEEFLNVYHNHECLWNSKCSSYSERRMRNNAYEELVHLCKPGFQENVANPQPPFYQSQRATSGQNPPYDDGCSSQELTELGPFITFKNQ
jgi:hypothetical protein